MLTRVKRPCLFVESVDGDRKNVDYDFRSASSENSSNFLEKASLHCPSPTEPPSPTCVQVRSCLYILVRDLKFLGLGFAPTVCKAKRSFNFNFLKLLTFNQTVDFIRPFNLCTNTCVIVFNKSVFNWTLCQLLVEKPNCRKI